MPQTYIYLVILLQTALHPTHGTTTKVDVKLLFGSCVYQSWKLLTSILLKRWSKMRQYGYNVSDSECFKGRMCYYQVAVWFYTDYKKHAQERRLS